MKTHTALLLTFLLSLVALTGVFVWDSPVVQQLNTINSQKPTALGSLLSQPPTSSQPEPLSAPPSASPSVATIPQSHVIPLQHHTFQTFNNCGPASLAMQLSYHSITVSQQELGDSLRPYQHPTGDNDDKSVTLNELAIQAKEYGVQAVYRPNGTMEKIEQLVANGLPVVVRTLLKPDDDIGHYRVIRGYNQLTKNLTQDDSLQGKSLEYSYDEMLALWQPFNYEYLVLFPDSKASTVTRILGDEFNEQTAWKNAETRIRKELADTPDDRYVLFNLSVTLTHLGQYEEAIQHFEAVEDRLPARTLWYQIEPIEAYYSLGQYTQVFALTNKILNNQNRAFSELYLIRGRSYQAQGQIQAARNEFEQAVRYNRNSSASLEALNSLPN